MNKRGSEALILLVVLLVAIVGTFFLLMPGPTNTGMYGEMMGCQSTCFGTAPGEARVGQQTLGGSALRQCLADCQAGIPYQQPEIQECYTCSCPSEGITANNRNEARVVCQRVCGSEATIIRVVSGPCKY